jgi:predicted nucleic acid-binding protein
MSLVCLLDSSVIIDAINDRNGRNELLEQMIGRGILLACCPIQVTEVYMGMRPNEAARTQQFLESLEFYPVTWEIAKNAGELYREWRQKRQTLALPDLTVAAVAIQYGLQLATDNARDFPMAELQLYPLT